jgi:hypothetical protein
MGIGTPSSQSRMERPMRSPPRSIGHGHRRNTFPYNDWRSCGSRRGVGTRRLSVLRQSTPQSLELPRSEERDRTSRAPCCNQNQAPSFFYCWSVDVPAAPPRKGWLLRLPIAFRGGDAGRNGSLAGAVISARQQPPHVAQFCQRDVPARARSQSILRLRQMNTAATTRISSATTAAETHESANRLSINSSI